MSTATFVFMIATYWVGGSGSTEGGKYLANGQLYNNKEFVAAHRTLPFGTILNVCLRRQCVAVVVKDRGPFLAKMDIERRIDLSYGAAKALGMLHDGRQRVRISVPVPDTKAGYSISPHQVWRPGRPHPERALPQLCKDFSIYPWGSRLIAPRLGGAMRS